MLVLTRKVGERIWIGPDVSITVLEVRGEKVRLGIAAPREVNVQREEIRDQRLAGPDANRVRGDGAS